MKDYYAISRRSVIVLGAGAVTGALGGVFSKGAFAQSPVGKMSISMGTTPQFSSVVVGHQKGYFKEYGLETELSVFASGSVATEAFVSGQGHIVIAGDVPSLRLWSRGFVGVSGQASYSDLSIVVARQELTKAEDFRGKKIGVLMSSTSEHFASLFLASGGLKLDDVQVVNLQPAEMVTGLASGDIDGFVIWQPFGWRAVEAIKGAHIVTTAAPFFHEYQTVTTTKEYAEGHEAELVAFIKGLRDAGAWTKDNPDEAAAIVNAFLRMNNLELARKMIDAIDFSPKLTAKLRQDLTVLSKFVDVELDWSTMFNHRFLELADPALVEL